MIQFPLATYAALLPPDMRDVFAVFCMCERGRAEGFSVRGLERAALGLPLKARPRRS